MCGRRREENCQADEENGGDLGGKGRCWQIQWKWFMYEDKGAADVQFGRSQFEFTVCLAKRERPARVSIVLFGTAASFPNQAGPF